MEQLATNFTLLVILGGLCLIYFLPSVVAAARNHRQNAPILALNFFLGWTLIGWVGALVWALVEERRA